MLHIPVESKKNLEYTHFIKSQYNYSGSAMAVFRVGDDVHAMPKNTASQLAGSMRLVMSWSTIGGWSKN